MCIRDRVYSDSSLIYLNEAFKLIRNHKGRSFPVAPFYFGKASAAWLQRDHLSGLTFCNRGIEVAGNDTFQDSLLLLRSYNLKGVMLKKLEQYDLAENSFHMALTYFNRSISSQYKQEIFRELALLAITQEQESVFFYYLNQIRLEIECSKKQYVYPVELLGYFHPVSYTHLTLPTKA